MEEYPFAATPEMAVRKGNYWEKSGLKDDPQLLCLRDLLSLVEVLQGVIPSQELATFAGGINRLLIKISHEKTGERFSLIALIERAPYPTAQAAYNRFMNTFGPGSEKYQPDQVITETARFLGRAVTEQDQTVVKQCLQTLVSIAGHRPKFILFVLKETLKNMSEIVKKKHLEHRYQQWRPEAIKDTEVVAELHLLMNQVFLGTGHNGFRRIK